MPRKPKKGYYVKGNFVAYDSELDQQLQRERKAQTQTNPDKPSRTQQKHEAKVLQKLGVELLTLHPDRMADLALDDPLRLAIAQAKRITSFEAKRRQMQYIGKLLRKLDASVITALEATLQAQLRGTRTMHPKTLVQPSSTATH